MRFLRSFLLLALVGSTLIGSVRCNWSARAEDPTPTSAPSAVTQNLAPEIASLLVSGSIPGSPTSVERDLLNSLYPLDAPEPLWLDESGGLTAAGRQAVDLLAGAASHGLNPAHYRVDMAPSSLAPFDVELSLAMLRYLGDITFGRVDPAQLGHQQPARGDRSALPASLRRAACRRSATRHRQPPCLSATSTIHRSKRPSNNSSGVTDWPTMA